MKRSMAHKRAAGIPDRASIAQKVPVPQHAFDPQRVPVPSISPMLSHAEFLMFQAAIPLLKNLAKKLYDKMVTNLTDTDLDYIVRNVENGLSPGCA